MTRNHLAMAGKCATAFAWRGLVLASLGATLAGCQTPAEDYSASIWSNYRVRHPISIVEKNRKLEIFVGSTRNGLTADQRADVLAYAQTWRNEGTGRFVIEQPSGARNARSAAMALSEIRSILTATGVPHHAIKVQSYRADRNTLAVIRVNYPQLAAHVGPCGQWPEDLGADANPAHFENVHYWNFGCATQRNLAAMVENPADLVQPRAEGPVYAARRNTVLDKYRRGEATSTTYPNPDKGAISDLGK